VRAAVEGDRLVGRRQPSAGRALVQAQAQRLVGAAGRRADHQVGQAVAVDVGVVEHRVAGGARDAVAQAGDEDAEVREGRSVEAAQRRRRRRRRRAGVDRAGVEEDADRAAARAGADQHVELAIAVVVVGLDRRAAPRLAAEVRQRGVAGQGPVRPVEGRVAVGRVLTLVDIEFGVPRRGVGRAGQRQDVGPAVAVEVGGHGRSALHAPRRVVGLLGPLDVAGVVLEHAVGVVGRRAVELGRADLAGVGPVGLGVLVGAVLVDPHVVAGLVETDEVVPAVAVEVGDRREHAEVGDAQVDRRELSGGVGELEPGRGVPLDAVLGGVGVEEAPRPRRRRRGDRAGGGGHGDRAAGDGQGGGQRQGAGRDGEVAARIERHGQGPPGE
jgi:hypothetical protein